VLNVEYHRFHDHLQPLLPRTMREPIAGRVTLGAAGAGIGIATVGIGLQPDGGRIRLHGSVR
jgi:hypothetical protein